MASEDSKDLKKYFENDPPSFFDDLAAKEGMKRSSNCNFYKSYCSFLRRITASDSRSQRFVATSWQSWESAIFNSSLRHRWLFGKLKYYKSLITE